MTRRLKSAEHRSPDPRVQAARAEVERLAKQAAYEKARADRLEASAEALRAENVFLQKEVQRARGQLMDFEKIRAEVERFDRQLTERNSQLGKALDEIERLRAALFRIADDTSHADQYVQWAQEALSQT